VARQRRTRPNPGFRETAAVRRAFMAELDKLCPRNPRGVYTFLSFAKGGYCRAWTGTPCGSPTPPLPRRRRRR